jgi:hypothetical protein
MSDNESDCHIPQNFMQDDPIMSIQIAREELERSIRVFTGYKSEVAKKLRKQGAVRISERELQ